MESQRLYDSSRRLAVKILILTFEMDLICLQETRMANLSQQLFRSMGAGHINNWVWLNLVGFSGEVFVGCNSKVLTKKKDWIGDHSISVSIASVKTGSTWLFTGLYIAGISPGKRGILVRA